jgi:hypothetical protein
MRSLASLTASFLPLLLAGTIAAAQSPLTPPSATDTWRIETPQDLALIRAARPDHYRKILGILDGIQDQPDRKVAQWMATRFDAKQVDYHPLLLVSLPPKRKLSFALDGVHYAGTIVLDKYGADLLPLE